MLFKAKLFHGKDAWIESSEVQVIFDIGQGDVQTTIIMKDGRSVDLRDSFEVTHSAVSLANKERTL